MVVKYFAHICTRSANITHGVPFSLRRTRTQANLDARTTFAGEGREQRCARRGQPSKVDFVGGEQAVLCQRRRRQQGALLEAQLDQHRRQVPGVRRIQVVVRL